jgi:mannose-1-phosphate guanylyltransferase
MRVDTALIVAGGRGTRLQPLTHDLPKPLVPFCGEPFLAGVIRRLAASGVETVLLIVGAETEPFEMLRPLARRLGIRLETVAESEPLDTAGGVRSVAEDLPSPVLVLNGDILTSVDYAAVVRRHDESGADATIVLTRVEETSSFGVAVREGTRITRFVEKPDPGALPGHDTVNAGTYVLDPAALLHLPRGPLSFERDVFPSMLEDGAHIEGFVWDGVWQDLGTPERYREGHRLALVGDLDWPSVRDVDEVAAGVRVAAGAEIDAAAHLESPILILDRTRIAAEATVGPGAFVGTDCEIGAGAVVTGGAVLHGHVTLGDGVVARGLIAGEGACVESGAELGRDVVLGPGEVVRAGARVEDDERRPRPRDD